MVTACRGVNARIVRRKCRCDACGGDGDQTAGLSLGVIVLQEDREGMIAVTGDSRRRHSFVTMSRSNAPAGGRMGVGDGRGAPLDAAAMHVSGRQKRQHSDRGNRRQRQSRSTANQAQHTHRSD